MKLAVFYHLAALNHLWKDFIDEQLGLIKKVGLADVAKTYVCYVAPDEYFDEVREYLQREYSFVTILSSRRTTEENLYEGQTLKELQEYSKTHDGYVLYLHSKGVLHSVNSYQTIPTRDWRHYMNYWMIERWKECVKKLEDVSVVGTNYNQDPYPHLSGNFWWASTDYIRTLPDVLNRSLYYDERLTEKLAGHTFSYEMWVLYNKPKVDSIHSSKVNHYLQPYPREKYARLENTMLNQKKIAVFYHLFIPELSSIWTWWVDEQMGLLKSTGLADLSTVNMCITVPLNIVDSKNKFIFDQLVVNYIRENYPFVNILDVRGTHEYNLFEGQTISQLYQYCLKNDGYVFYFHNKGMSSYGTHISSCLKDWRHYMQYFNIERWKDCVEKLDEGYDCCGVSWIKREDLAGNIKTEGKRYIGNHFSGNFWWARCDYIKRLPDPLNVESYVHIPSLMDTFKTYRYAFEVWIGDEKTNYYSFHQSNIHHYCENYPRKNYANDNQIKVREKRSIRNLIQEVGSKNNFNWREHIHFAQWIVKRKQPKVVVDLGVDYGYSTFSFAIPKIGKVYGIDSFEGDELAGKRNTYDYVIEMQKEMGLDHITFIKGYFDEISKIWDKKIDVLHIDGFHSYNAIKNDYETWTKFLDDNGIILMHDTCVESPGFGVKQFFNEINLPKLNFFVSHGLGVVTKDVELLKEIYEEFKEIIDSSSVRFN